MLLPRVTPEDQHSGEAVAVPRRCCERTISTLAHLQLGRGYVQSGNTAKAKATYRDFLALWKDADPDIPILREAKAEYAKMQ